MADTWAVFPSGNSEAAQTCSDAWAAAGYRTAVLIAAGQKPVRCDVLMIEESYGGIPKSFKLLCDTVIDDHGANLIACINDDMFPTFNAGAENVANRFAAQFPNGCGAMQPTGDWYSALAWCCPSPVVNAEFAKRYNGGKGIFWPEYYHFYCDQEFRDVTLRLGCLFETDLIGFEHRHWTRGHVDQLPVEKREKIQSRYDTDKMTYINRANLWFPGAAI